MIVRSGMDTVAAAVVEGLHLVDKGSSHIPVLAHKEAAAGDSRMVAGRDTHQVLADTASNDPSVVSHIVQVDVMDASRAVEHETQCTRLEIARAQHDHSPFRHSFSGPFYPSYFDF